MWDFLKNNFLPVTVGAALTAGLLYIYTKYQSSAVPESTSSLQDNTGEPNPGSQNSPNPTRLSIDLSSLSNIILTEIRSQTEVLSGIERTQKEDRQTLSLIKEGVDFIGANMSESSESEPWLAYQG